MWYKWPECFKCPNVQSDISVQSIQNVLNVNSEKNVHINQCDQIVQRVQSEQSNQSVQSVMLVKSHQKIWYRKFSELLTHVYYTYAHKAPIFYSYFDPFWGKNIISYNSFHEW